MQSIILRKTDKKQQKALEKRTKSGIFALEKRTNNNSIQYSLYLIFWNNNIRN